MGFTTGTYAGQPHFTCDDCPVDSLDLAAITAHVARVHPSAAASPAPADVPTAKPSPPRRPPKGRKPKARRANQGGSH